MEREATIDPENVLVDYYHPHGRIEGVKISDLLSTPVEFSRPVMAISSPRCTDGQPLDWKQLRKRTKKGDLVDYRIERSAPER